MSRPSVMDVIEDRRSRDAGSYLAGARASVPFALATLVLGISFGVLARSLGWGIVAPIVFSVIAFSGSAQFAVAAVLGAGGGALAAIVAAVLLNARFGPIGATVPQGVAWIAGTAIGAVSGDFIGDPERLGLDVIFPAFFLALLAEELRDGRAVAVALIAAALALALVPFAPPGVPVIAACAAALLGLRRRS